MTNRSISPLDNIHAVSFTEYDLDNGIHVILAPSASTPLVVTNLWYHVGSKDDPPARTGFAHLFEHMMFQGSRNVPRGGHFKYIHDAGGTLNASTNADRTNYFEMLPAERLELALWLESDRLLSLDVNQENFENQRAVVKEERRQRYDNRPYGTVWEEISKRLWPNGTYHHSTIGSMEDLDQASIDDVISFHREFYKPNNCSLTIAGNFKEAEARRMIDRYFGSIPKAEPVNWPKYEIYPITAPVRFQIEDNIKLQEVNVVFQGPQSYFGRERYALELLSLAMDNSRSSRMYKELIYRRKIAQYVDVLTAWFEKCAGLMFQARVQPGIEIGTVEDAIWGEIDRICREPMSEAELSKIKNRAEMQIVAENVTLLSRADRLQVMRCFAGDTNVANQEREVFASITAEEIHSAANKYLVREHSVVCHVVPKLN